MPAPALLPDSVEEMLRTASLEELTALFETLPLDARDPDEGRSVLSFPECSCTGSSRRTPTRST